MKSNPPGALATLWRPQEDWNAMRGLGHDMPSVVDNLMGNLPVGSSWIKVDIHRGFLDF
jgi:hypothetical protein